MTIALVTGCAGFVGSHLSEKLIELGYQVKGIDSFLDYYPRKIKEDNLKNLLNSKDFSFIEADILKADLSTLLDGVEYIFHEAAQAGVRASWGKSFEVYTQNNILTTQTLLEAAKESPQLKKFVYASSSSIYGDTDILPMREDGIPKPVSPYGVSKLAGEHLCYLYFKNFGVPTVSLRYFTVYGPRQRPDMAFNKFISAILKNKEIQIYGSGKQTRDFTFVADIVDATIQASKIDANGDVFNIGGGSRVTVTEVINLIGEILGKPAKTEYTQTQHGDVLHTWANISKAQKILQYNPKVNLKEGLKEEIAWLKKTYV
ncbi:MAG: NAD-dependent epimerase/dehydratase family protein [bacterium]